MAISTVNGVDLYYEDSGSGPPLLLVIGFTENTSAWDGVRERLVDRFRVLVFDNRCAGQSTYTDECSMADMASDAIGLADALGLDRFHIGGQSMGSAIAQLVALDHPDRIESLTLINSFARVDRAVLAVFVAFGAMRAAGVDIELVVRSIVPWMNGEQSLVDEEHIDALVQEALAMPHPQTLDGYERQLAALREFDNTMRLGDIAARTLVIAGHEDRVAPVRGSELLAATIPAAQLLVLPTGHGSLHEAPDLVAAAIAQHLG